MSALLLLGMLVRFQWISCCFPYHGLYLPLRIFWNLALVIDLVTSSKKKSNEKDSSLGLGFSMFPGNRRLLYIKNSGHSVSLELSVQLVYLLLFLSVLVLTCMISGDPDLDSLACLFSLYWTPPLIFNSFTEQEEKRVSLKASKEDPWLPGHCSRLVNNDIVLFLWQTILWSSWLPLLCISDVHREPVSQYFIYSLLEPQCLSLSRVTTDSLTVQTVALTESHVGIQITLGMWCFSLDRSFWGTI